MGMTLNRATGQSFDRTSMGTLEKDLHLAAVGEELAAGYEA
jgi:hypothetical protein